MIVNADDFGYSLGVNRGIIEAYEKGIVTSTSVMVDGIGAHEAAELKKFPDLSLGLHLTFKNLVRIGPELHRQLEKFIHIVGAEPDHIDTHKIITTEGELKDILEAYCNLKGIPLRRHSGAQFIGTYFGPHANDDLSPNMLMKAIDEATDEYNEIMCHPGYSDDYLYENSSYNEQREAELKTLCDPEIKRYIADRGLELCNWRQMRL